MEELPVFEYGCDSSYSWSKKFKHLQRKNTPEQIADLIIDSMRNEHNPLGLFKHPKTGIEQHMCFTGGEPLLMRSQECTVEIFKYMQSINNEPYWITFETNGTQMLTATFIDTLSKVRKEVFFSVSPKLFNTSGEKARKAICPEIVREYDDISRGKGQLKFVVNGRDETWNELDDVVYKFREAGVSFPVYIMPVGATLEGQAGELEGHMSAGNIAEQAYKRGYYVSSRVHVNLWGNLIGV
jgi:organic radical activating enzyme